MAVACYDLINDCYLNGFCTQNCDWRIVRKYTTKVRDYPLHLLVCIPLDINIDTNPNHLRVYVGYLNWTLKKLTTMAS